MDISHNCPNVTQISVDIGGIHRPNYEFLPLIGNLDLTHLRLPGEGNDEDLDEDDFGVPNFILAGHIAHNCNHLQVSYFDQSLLKSNFSYF